MEEKLEKKNQPVPVIDMHCDTIALIRSCRVQAENKGKNGETVSVYFKVTEKEMEEGIHLRRNGRMLDAERLKASGSFCQCLGLCSSKRSAAAAGVTPWEYLNLLCDTFDEEVESCRDILRPVTTASEMEKNFSEGFVSVLKTIEDGMAMEGNIENLKVMYQRGVRVAGFTWNFENELGFGHQLTETGLLIDDKNGLKPAGFAFTEAMEEMGMLMDISHLNDAGTRDVFDTVKASTPVLATHSNARGLCRHARNLPDDLLKKLADHGGVTGINFCHAFLNDRYMDDSEKLSRIEDMCAHMKYIRNLAGIDCIGLGSDFDGITSTLEVNGCGEMQKIAEGMDRAGFTSEEIEKVFYKNVLRVFREVLG